MKKRTKLVLSVLAGAVLAMQASAQSSFGGPEDIAYAAALWTALQNVKLAGGGAIQTKAYPGQQPHGAILQTMYTTLSVEGLRNEVIVQRSYGGDGVSIQAVSDNPEQFLAAVLVMYKRPGYDAGNNDWYWANYLPDGSLHKNPKGSQFAGRVTACIACHTTAPGGNMLFTR